MRYGVNNNQGIGVVTVLLVVLVVGLAVAGAVAWQAQQDDEEPSAAQTSNQSESEPKKESPAVADKKGTFSGVPPKTGSGSVTLTQNANGAYVVQLGDDFAVQEGPDLYVSFGNNGEVDHNTLFSTLNAFSGTQEYTVPSTIDVSKYSQVLIYCKEFSVVFSVAPLE